MVVSSRDLLANVLDELPLSSDEDPQSKFLMRRGV